MSDCVKKPDVRRPAVHLVGDVERAEFRDAATLLGETAQLTIGDHPRQAASGLAQAAPPPDLIVVAQGRPGTYAAGDLRRLRRAAPLAGVVGLLGSWCEGETRSGRPWAGVERCYWYEFPGWWRRQLDLFRAGCCPDWARPPASDAAWPLRLPCQMSDAQSARGLVVLCTLHWDAADSLSDVLAPAGYATAWQAPGRRGLMVRGVSAGVWEGGQLDDREALELAAFARQLAGDGAPVVALLDFPRRDRCLRALRSGAAAVLGKPWLNSDLAGTIEQVTRCREVAGHTALVARAA